MGEGDERGEREGSSLVNDGRTWERLTGDGPKRQTRSSSSSHVSSARSAKPVRSLITEIRLMSYFRKTTIQRQMVFWPN